MDRSTDRALAWLSKQQQPDGSFPSFDTGQPAVTALCAMAFMSRGYLPDDAKYGPQVTKAVEYVLSCQRADGLIAKYRPTAAFSSQNQTSSYNHAIAALFLSEVYGMTQGKMHQTVRKGVESAVAFAKRRRPDPKQQAYDKGGWRYVLSKGSGHDDSDLSVTSWHLMFLRSARNAGFDVPSQLIEESLGYVKRCFDPSRGTFLYSIHSNRDTTRPMAGAGILAMSLAGQHQTTEAQLAAKYVLEHNFVKYQAHGDRDRFFYGAFYCSQAMYQLGGVYWDQFHPVLLRTLINNQQADGSWEEELIADQMFGRTYSTAMAVLAIAPPYQVLPIFQR